MQDPIPKRVKYREILTYLQAAISDGKYGEGTRLPSEASLVTQFGASRPTVVRALRELQVDGLIDRRVGAGTYVKKKSTGAVGLSFGLLVPGLTDGEIFEPICVALARDAQVMGHTLLWGDLTDTASGSPDEAAEQMCRDYIRRRVAGVFFSPLEFSGNKDQLSRRIVRLFDAAGVPVVLLDRDLVEPPARSHYDVVSIDNHRAGYLLAEHLLSLGCRTIHFLSRPFSAPTVQTRTFGYQAALLAAGVMPSLDWVKNIDAEDVAQVCEWMKADRPDAIVCANDKTAAQLMQTLAGLGISVPQDVRVVGVDDLRYARLLRPALTTVHQPCQLLATLALHTMLERLATPSLPPRHTMLAGDLVIRQSCGSESKSADRKAS